MSPQTQPSDEKSDLPLKQVDLKVAAAVLRDQLVEIRNEVKRIDEAKIVTKQLLDKEVSI